MSDKAPESLDWLESHCRNCGQPLTGPFCSHCGQKAFRQRLSMKSLIMSVPERIFNLERGLLFTFWQLCRNPGVTARDYVVGKRVDRVNPISYFLIAATVQLIALFFTREQLTNTMIDQVSQNEAIVQQLQERHGENGVALYADVYYTTVQQAYTYLAFLFMAIPFACFLWLFSKKQRSQYKFAEISVFSLYTVGHVILLTGLMALITIQISTTLHSGVSMLLYFVYAYFAVKAFFDKQHVSQIASFFALLVSVIIFLFAILTTFAIFMAKHTIDGVPV